jgi:SAM-dependent methyltransferase
MHQSSIDKMQSFKDKYLADKRSEQSIVLDLGSQNIGGCYKQIFDGEDWNYSGVDLAPGDNVDIVLRNPYQWEEIRSNSVDVLISGQTLEHAEYFWLTMMEIARVLKPGGLCCLVAPSSGYEHRYPVDCWRFYPDGMRAMANFARLQVLDAYTQWDDEEYADGSNVWHDSVLIASKPLEELTGTSEIAQFEQRHHQILTEKGQTELYRLQLQQSQADAEKLQNQIYQLQYQLQQSQAELANSQAQLTNSQAQLTYSQQYLQQIESGKLWKIATGIFKLKKKILE